MARSITLRYDTTCHDCGRTLPAGTVARWFGKGRVSCCGQAQRDADPNGRGAERLDSFRPAAAPPSPSAAPLSGSERAIIKMQAHSDALAALPRMQGERDDPQTVAWECADRRGYCNGTKHTEEQRALYVVVFLATLDSHARAQTGRIPQRVEGPRADVARADVAPANSGRWCAVYLHSGAVFLVPEEHRAHVVRCITESMVDKVRQ